MALRAAALQACWLRARPEMVCAARPAAAEAAASPVIPATECTARAMGRRQAFLWVEATASMLKAQARMALWERLLLPTQRACMVLITSGMALWEAESQAYRVSPREG